jgi:hypothetical protein
VRTVKTWALLVQSDDTATSEDAHLTPPSHWLPGRGTLYGGRAGREPLSLNAGDPIVTVLALISSSAPKKRHGVLDRPSDVLRDDYRALSGHGVAVSEDRHQFLTLHLTDVRFGSKADVTTSNPSVR